MALENAPDHIKLAVDLIDLLEGNQIQPQTAIDALKIVLKDYEKKLSDESAIEKISMEGSTN
ncbi:pleiotropic regulatory protein RsmS [Marinomonas balearica]|uniref:Uncharacterized protein DUF2496 n=1 Tax=Marinomonas balearica TaxID=491947 RepID=A0A4R6MDU7_9GAMM|nr:pleiotropic regulatory protein RsmS [Marinomonas balearica]TDO99395.1 uncharacterized protein DUF2496 [Marinomonas balearica]